VIGGSALGAVQVALCQTGPGAPDVASSAPPSDGRLGQSRHAVSARIWATIRRLLIRHGYPPDQQPAAINLVMQQQICSAE
jgi:hypothetical protein